MELDPSLAQGRATDRLQETLARQFTSSMAVQIEIEAITWPRQAARDMLEGVLATTQQEGRFMCCLGVASFLQRAASEAEAEWVHGAYRHSWIIDPLYDFVNGLRAGQVEWRVFLR